MNQKLFTGIAITLIALVIAIAGYIVLTTKPSSPEPLRPIAPISGPTPLPSIVPYTNPPAPAPKTKIDTSSWKTYRNDKYRFEVRYPSDWILRLSDSQDARLGFGPIDNKLPSVDLRIVKNSEVTKQAHFLIVDSTTTKQIKRIIDGADATEVFNDSYKQFPESVVYFTRDSKGFIFARYYGTDKSEQVFDQILSTFKFTK